MVLRQPKYIATTATFAFVLFTLAVWLSNWSLAIKVLCNTNAPFLEKLQIISSLYGSIGTNFTMLSATYTIGIVVLFSVNISLLHYLGKRDGWSLQQGSSPSLVGIVSGVFGIGCAACGSLILSTILPVMGLGGALSLLPFGGQEFGLIGIALLVYSTYVLSKRVTASSVCPVL